MLRFAVLALTASLAAAKGLRTHLAPSLDELREIPKGEFLERRAEMRKGLPEDHSRDFASFAETKPSLKFQSNYDYKPTKKQASRLNAAHKRDLKMYGGKTFEPPAGHDLYFDFDSFAAYSEAQHKSRLANAASMQTTSNQTVQGTTFTTSESLTACLEVNVCALFASSFAGTSGPNVCGQFGINGGVTLKTENNKQTLTLTAGLNAGVSFKLGSIGGVTAGFSIYIFGQADWTWKLSPQKRFNTVYEAIFQALKEMMMGLFGSKKTPKAIFKRAAAARQALVSKEQDVADGKPQTDELTGMVKLSYNIMDKYLTALKASPTVPTFTAAQQMLHLSVYDAIYSPAKAKLTAAKKKSSIEQMIDSDDFPCAKLNKAVKTSVRQNPQPLGIDNALMCSVLKYGALMPDGERKNTSGIIWDNEGSNFNSGKSVALLFPELFPSTATDVKVIIKALDQWSVRYKKLVPADFGATQTLSETIDGKTYTRTIQADKPADVTAYDPAQTARKLYQALALPEAQLEDNLNQMNGNAANDNNPKYFTFEKVEIEGGIGATFGGGRVGFCTNDANIFQIRVSYKWEYTPANGWVKPGKSPSVWMAFAFSSIFQIQVTIPFSGITDDDPLKLRFHFTMADGFTAGNGGLDISDSASTNQVASWISPLTEYLGIAFAEVIQTFVEAREAGADSQMTHFKNAIKAILNNNGGLLNNVKKFVPADYCNADMAKKVFDGVLKGTGVAAKAAVEMLMKSAPVGIKTASLTEIGVELHFNWTPTSYSVGGAGSLANTKMIQFSTDTPWGQFNAYLITGTEMEVSYQKQLARPPAKATVPAASPVAIKGKGKK